MSQRHSLLVFALALLVNVLGASGLATEGDALGETRRALGSGDPRPSHLLQTPLFRVASRLAAETGFSGAPFVPLQTLNALLGALAATLLFQLLRRYGVRRPTATIAVAVWVFSWAPWFHARTAETGVTSLPFLLGAFVLLLRGSSAGGAGVLRAALSGVLLAFAVLLSLANALLAPAWLFVVAKRSGGRAFGAGAIAVTLGVAIPFLVTAAGEGVSPAELPAWITHHPDSAGLDPGGRLGAARAVTGLGRLVFPVSAGETAIKAKLVGADVEWDWKDLLTLARNLLAVVLLVGAAALGAWRLGRNGEPGIGMEPARRTAAMAVLAIVPTAAFNTYWLGSDPQFWLPVYPFLLLLAALAHDLCFPRPEPAAALLSGALVVTLYLTNVVIGPPTSLHPSGDDRWRGASEIASRMPHAALVLRPGVGHSPLEFLPHFRPDVRVVSLAYDAPAGLRGEELLAWIDREIARAQADGRSVYFEGLTGSLPPPLLGPWGYVANARGLTREGIREHLRRTQGLDAVPGISQHLVRIRAGAGAGEV